MNTQSNRARLAFRSLWALVFVASVCAGPVWCESPVRTAANRVAARLASSLELDALLALDDAAVLNLLTPAERTVFATRHWRFEVNVPVVVSVVRDTAQPVVPFWLPEAGFTKTEMTVRNEAYTYEVWQREFDAGRVTLGVNGVDKHRPHYFVVVAPKEPGTALALSNFFPEDQQIFEMKEGSSIYHDWPELVLTEVPEALRGQILLPTIRGRAREAHIVQAFRQTPFPASTAPDEVMLTWSDDPGTTQTVQWRTAAPVMAGTVQYRRSDAAADAPWIEVRASARAFEDQFLINDPIVRRFTATLRGLTPGTAYTYRVGNPATGEYNEPAEFRTEPVTSSSTTFIFLSDTHSSQAAGELMFAALNRYPETAFAVVSGDLVGTGQYRDDWDKFFGYCEPFTRVRPLMPSIGNHDAIDGLGADLYLDSFDLPRNGPRILESERTYSFEYGDALFLMMDVTEPIAPQAAWIEKELSRSKAKWKFAVMHFPAYFPEDADPQIRESWVPLFDKYHVDFVLSGHVHDYMRSYPMRGGAIVDSPNDGTIYMLTVSLNDGGPMPAKPEYAAVMEKPGVALTVVFRIEGNRATLQAEDKDGKVYDTFTVEKP